MATNNSISLIGLDKAAVLAALYNASRPLGMGFMHYTPEPMTAEQAQAIGPERYFDYLNGRVMKVDLSGDEFSPRLYDRDNGPGAAQAAIDTLQTTGNAADASLLATGHLGKVEAAQIVKDHLHEKDSIDASDPNVLRFNMGLSDVADILGSAIDDALDN